MLPPFWIDCKSEVNETCNIALIKRLKTTYDENEKVPCKNPITSNSINMHHMIETLACMVDEIGNLSKMMWVDGGINFLGQENVKLVDIVMKLNDMIKERQKKEKESHY